jgi:glycosyltransferase involved in cell wall biosynthesis
MPAVCRKRVLFVVNNPSFFLSHRLPIARAAISAGFDVHLATAPGPGVEAVVAAGIEWHPFRLSRAGRNAIREIGTFIDLVRLYRRIRPDIVHHVTSKPVLYGTVACRIAGVPAVVNAISGLGHVFADDAAWAMRRIVSAGYRFSLRHARMRVIFQNDEHRSLFLKREWVRDVESVLIPGVGVDTSVFVPKESTRSTPVVLLASRLLWTKGIGEFAQAARQLHQEGAQARFVIAGSLDPENRGHIPERQLEQWVDEGILEYWGFHEDVNALMQQADIACLPSYSEGLPKSLVEAAACGLPIVATDIGGCRAVVRDGENGLLVPRRDSERLAAALRGLITHREVRARMGACSRVMAVREFDIQRITSAHLALYQDLSS